MKLICLLPEMIHFSVLKWHLLFIQVQRSYSKEASQQKKELVSKFRRRLNNWEIERVTLLLGNIGQVSISSTEVDIPLWKHNGDGIFSVKSAYTRGFQVTDTNTQCKWNYFWKSSIPTKVMCFTWLVIKRACLNPRSATEEEENWFQGVFCVWWLRRQTSTFFCTASTLLSCGICFSTLLAIAGPCLSIHQTFLAAGSEEGK